MAHYMSNSEWLGKSVIYQVFIDRFFRAGRGAFRGKTPAEEQTPPAFCGGNLQGVAAKMDYLSELGVDALWLTPFHPTAAYHGYHVTDFHNVAVQFGGLAGFKTLVNAAKSRGIRLIMDFVANHVHETHPWFVEAKRHQRSPYRDWFYWLRHGDYLKFLNYKELPKLNLDHPAARDEMIGAAKHWLDQGIDGFRLDHALGPSMEFWREFRRQIKQHSRSCALIGEVWLQGINGQMLPTLSLPQKRFYCMACEGGFDMQEEAMREYAEVFDGLLDFQFQKILKTFVARAKWPVASAKIQNLLDRHYAGFPLQCQLLSFLDNHDMNRFLFEAGGDKTRLRKAVEMQFAQKQPPVIYYGDEIGMNQPASIHEQSYGDRHARCMMEWQQPDHAIFSWYKCQIRKWKARV